MSTGNTGAAREVAPGRLARFEDADDLVVEPAIALPPRRRRTTPTGDKPAPAQRDKPAAVAEPAPARPAPDVADEPQPSGTGGTRRDKGPKGPEDRVRPSNVHIPVALLEPLTAKCKTDGLSHGEVIIVAIEAAYPQMQDLIHPPATAGGSLFASRRSRASRAADGPLTPLNYRLREGDYATLDQLVEQFGASSRGHLITVALLHYFRDQISA
jgi:hypothetical protein